MDELGTRRTTERVRESETLGLRCGGLTSWRGCEGLAEFTLNCGMYDEAHHGTWEAPEIDSGYRSSVVEYLKGKNSSSGVADAA